MTCSHCGYNDNPPDARLCVKCGQPITTGPGRVTAGSLLRVTADPDEIGLEPGSQLTVTITLEHLGTTVDQFALSLEGLPAGWYTWSAREVSLFPQSSERVTLTLHPPRTAAARAGTYRYRIVVTARQDAGRAAATEAILHLVSFGELLLAIEPELVRARRAAYRLTLSNRGNAPRSVVLSASDPEEALVFQGLPRGAVTVEPAEQATIPLVVKPRRPSWTGPDQHYRFRVVATPPGIEWEEQERRAVEAEIIYPPYLKAWPWAGWPRWVLRLAMVGLPLAALAVALNGPAIFSPVPPPAIEKFELQLDPVDAVKLLAVWKVSQEAIEVTIDGEQVAKEGSRSVACGQSLYIVATNKAGSASRSLGVICVGPPKIVGFTADRATIAPGEQVTLTWHVEGVEQVQLNGQPQPREGKYIENNLSESKSYTLTAENSFGPVKHTVTVTVVAPAATPSER